MPTAEDCGRAVGTVEGAMEFPELVHACSYRGCMEKNDFLPFTCDGCQKKFCLDHHRHENHGCHAKPRDDKYVPVCPLCMQAISVKPNDDVNAVIDQVKRVVHEHPRRCLVKVLDWKRVSDTQRCFQRCDTAYPSRLPNGHCQVKEECLHLQGLP